MYISKCFTYDDLNVKLKNINGSISIQLKNEKNIELAIILHPMQCKILGQALFNASMQMEISTVNIKNVSNGAVQIEFDLEKEQEEKRYAKTRYKIS